MKQISSISSLQLPPLGPFFSAELAQIIEISPSTPVAEKWSFHDFINWTEGQYFTVLDCLICANVGRKSCAGTHICCRALCWITRAILYLLRTSTILKLCRGLTVNTDCFYQVLGNRSVRAQENVSMFHPWKEQITQALKWTVCNERMTIASTRRLDQPPRLLPTPHLIDDKDPNNFLSCSGSCSTAIHSCKLDLRLCCARQRKKKKKKSRDGWSRKTQSSPVRLSW